MFFDVLIYKKPTKDEEENGGKDELLFYSASKPMQAKDQRAAGFSAIADLLVKWPKLRDDLDRIEVLLRPFA